LVEQYAVVTDRDSTVFVKSVLTPEFTCPNSFHRWNASVLAEQQLHFSWSLSCAFLVSFIETYNPSLTHNHQSLAIRLLV